MEFYKKIYTMMLVLFIFRMKHIDDIERIPSSPGYWIRRFQNNAENFK